MRECEAVVHATLLRDWERRHTASAGMELLRLRMPLSLSKHEPLPTPHLPHHCTPHIQVVPYLVWVGTDCGMAQQMVALGLAHCDLCTAYIHSFMF